MFSLWKRKPWHERTKLCISPHACLHTVINAGILSLHDTHRHIKRTMWSATHSDYVTEHMQQKPTHWHNPLTQGTRYFLSTHLNHQVQLFTQQRGPSLHNGHSAEQIARGKSSSSCAVVHSHTGPSREADSSRLSAGLRAVSVAIRMWGVWRTPVCFPASINTRKCVQLIWCYL